MALDTAEKQVQEYQTKIDALEEQLSRSGMLWFTVILSLVIFLSILGEHGAMLLLASLFFVWRFSNF